VKISSIKNQILVAEWLAEQLVVGEEKLKALAFALEVATTFESGHIDKKNCDTKTKTNTNTNDDDDDDEDNDDEKNASVRLEKKILKVEIELLLLEHLHVINGINGKENWQLEKETCNQLLASFCFDNKLSFIIGLYEHFAQLFYHLQSGQLHLAMEAICTKLEVSLSKLRLEMVQQWLIKDATEINQQNKSFHHKKNTNVLYEVTSSSLSKYQVFIPLEEEQNAQIDQYYMEQILYMISFVPKFPTEAQFQVFLHDMEDILSGLIKFAKAIKPRAGATYRAKRRAVCVVQKLMMDILLYHQKYQHQRHQQEDEDDVIRVRVYTSLLMRIEKEAAGSIGGGQLQQQTSHGNILLPSLLNVDEKKMMTLIKALDFMSIQYQYLSIFETLHLPLPSMNTWMQLKDKAPMIQSVFRECLSRTHTNSSERKKIIQLIGGLMIDFQITHIEVWEKLIQEFQQNEQMERFLLSFLDVLSESEL
jgi:hypothetical protein